MMPVTNCQSSLVAKRLKRNQSPMDKCVFVLLHMTHSIILHDKLQAKRLIIRSNGQCLLTKVLQGIQELYGVGADTFEQILAGRDLDMDSLEVDKDEANVLDEDEDEEASVVKFVNQIIRELRAACY